MLFEKVFRNGIIEATVFDYFSYNMGKMIPGQWVERALKDAAIEIFNDDLILPAVLIEDKTQIQKKLTCSFDIFWNAGGYIQSPSREESR
jgi:hypothetical protein